MKTKILPLFLALVFFFAACGEPEEPPVNGDTNGTNAANGTNAENGDNGTPPTNGENGDQTPPRPRSEWTLYIDGEETDVFLIIDNENNLLIPVEDVVLLFGGDVSYSESEGERVIGYYLNGVRQGGWLVDGAYVQDIDEVIYIYFPLFIEAFRYSGFNLFNRTDIENKILFIDKVEFPWMIYVDGSPTEFIISGTDTVSNRDVLHYRESMIDDIMSWKIPQVDVFRLLGAEFVHLGGVGMPNRHEVYLNGYWLGEVLTPESKEFLVDRVPYVGHIAEAITVNIDLGYNIINFFTP